MSDNTDVNKTAGVPENGQDAVDCVSSEARTDTVTLKGTTVFEGLALGKIHLLGEGELDLPQFQLKEEPWRVRTECMRLRAGFNAVTNELKELSDTTGDDVPMEASAFIDLHLQIISDQSLFDDTRLIIRDRLVNAEWALSLKLEELRKAFEDLDDAYLAERIVDIAQVIERVQRVIADRRRPSAENYSWLGDDENCILVAYDLSPADVLLLRRRPNIRIAGLVIETGSKTSHTAILARSLEIPTIVNVSGITEHVSQEDVVLLDAERGFVTVRPNNADTVSVKERINTANDEKDRLFRLRNAECVTRDGERVRLLSNIALPEDTADALNAGADGIGLFRSEFLFMNRSSMPDEDEQFHTYMRVVRAMKDKPVTIRTMDLGGDKVPLPQALAEIGIASDQETSVPNPALGLRAIRFSLAHRELFLTQLRAILRVSSYGKVRILLPMLSSLDEIDRARTLLRKAKADLAKRGVGFDENIAVGGMIEVPAAAVALPLFLRKLDFVSIGTNDLIQYTLAVDRHDPSVAKLYDPLHPAVLSLIAESVKQANKAGKEISVCGEMAGDPVCARILTGMGIRNLSMESARISTIKEMLLRTSCADAAGLYKRIRRMSNPNSIRKAAASADACEN